MQPQFWKDLAANVRVCFIESRLAVLRSYENILNEKQNLSILDSLNSDCVQYMLSKHPLPSLNFLLPPPIEEIRQKNIRANERNFDTEPIKIAVFGYNSYARAILESYRQDPYLKVHLVTKSIVERQRAEIDGKLAIFEIEDIIGTIDFWILATPFDDELDYRNQ